jgi:GT2 family glycosyltransferase
MNIGALNASYDYIVLLNNDTIVGKDWLYPLVKPLILNDYGIGSPITNNCGNEVKQFIHFTDIDDLLCKSNVLQKQNMFKTCEIDRVPFFCPVLRKKDFFAVGMLDINYKFGGWEDDDIMHKFKIYNNNKQNYYTFGSFVYHIESLSMSQITKTINWTHNNNNKQYFENKWNIKWVPPKYYTPNIDINIQSNIIWIHNLITNARISGKSAFTLCSNKKNKETIIIKDKIPDIIQDNEIIITVDKENRIVLSNKFESYTLNENPIIKLYSFINTTLFLHLWTFKMP